MINLQAYLHYKTFRLYKASNLNNVNLPKTTELIGPKLGLPLVHCWAQSGFQGLSSAVLTGCLQEPVLMLRLWMEQGRAQRPQRCRQCQGRIRHGEHQLWSDSVQRRRVQCLGLDRILPHYSGNGAQNALYAFIRHLEEVGLRVNHLLVKLLLI